MRLDQERFQAILLELMDENPLAVRAVLKILRTEFTTDVPTLAVSLQTPPRLLVNLEFLQTHCETDAHVKACILHEFLHVLLGHTQKFASMSEAQNIALDAVINAIIHRISGPTYSDMFARYYANEGGVARLLRPRSQADYQLSFEKGISDFDRIWIGLYDGRLVSDDILDIARRLEGNDDGALSDERVLIGSHDSDDESIGPEARQALADAKKQMSGSGVWRAPQAHGVGQYGSRLEILKANRSLEAWKAATYRILRERVCPDPKSRLKRKDSTVAPLPILSPRDKRAFALSLWGETIPFATWEFERERSCGSANVYLDVSGSMNKEMPLVIELLWRLRKAIRMPFWAFSNVVAPATIENGRLLTDTTGGTSLTAVLDHLEANRPPCAVIVTDGYVEPIDPRRVAALKSVRITAIVTRDGTTATLQQAGIEAIQLKGAPNG